MLSIVHLREVLSVTRESECVHSVRRLGFTVKRKLTPARIERTTLWTGITRSTTELRGHTRNLVIKVCIRKTLNIIHSPSVTVQLQTPK